MVKLRNSFSLIEVVFSIIIFSIIFSSIPTLIKVVAEANKISLDKDIMFQMNSKLYQMISFPWDENSKYTIYDFSHFVDVPNGYPANPMFERNIENNLTRNSKTGHRLFYTNKTYISTILGLDANESLTETNISIDDMDDFNNYSYLYSTNSREYNILVKIDFILEEINFLTDERLEINLTKNTSSNPTNIKKLSIQTIESDESRIKFNVFSANIGESEFKSREINKTN